MRGSKIPFKDYGFSSRKHYDRTVQRYWKYAWVYGIRKEHENPVGIHANYKADWYKFHKVLHEKVS